jgi:hypothetical protein
MDETLKHVKCTKSDTERQIPCFHFYIGDEKFDFIEVESGIVVTRGWEGSSKGG